MAAAQAHGRKIIQSLDAFVEEKIEEEDYDAAENAHSTVSQVCPFTFSLHAFSHMRVLRP